MPPTRRTTSTSKKSQPAAKARAATTVSAKSAAPAAPAAAAQNVGRVAETLALDETALEKFHASGALGTWVGNRIHIPINPDLEILWNDLNLGDLTGLPPTLNSAATQEHDGRLTRLVLVTLEDRFGQSRPALGVHLLDEAGTTIVDRTRTDRSGLAVLSFPKVTASTSGTGPATVADLPQIKGIVRVMDGTKDGFRTPVTIPAGAQFVDLTLIVETLPQLPLPATPAPVTSGTSTTSVTDAATAIVNDLFPPRGLGDDPISRLPSDFTPELYDALVRKLDLEGDPILGAVAGGDDFRARRAPMITRTTVQRIAPAPAMRTSLNNGQQQVNRFLVRLRQTWGFLGYSLGDLAEVESLDPGEILNETVGTIESNVEQIDKLVQQATQLTTSALQDQLSQQSKLDSLVKVATSTETYALAAGFAIGIPGLFGFGGGGALAGVNTSATTSTQVNTSLQVNHLLSTAQSIINQAVQQTTSQLSSLTRQITSQLGRVSPLLSRVTNLLRWHIFENYAVSTQVEDILQLVPVKILDIPQGTNLFSAEEIVEYRRFFEGSLLDPSVRGEFDSLARAVQINLDGGLPISRIEVEVRYAATALTGHLLVDINGAQTQLTLLPGGTTAKGTIRFEQPVLSSIYPVNLTLSSSLDGIGSDWLALFENLNNLAVDVTSIRFWATSGYGSFPNEIDTLDLHVSGGTGTATTNIVMSAAIPQIATATNPLVRHINQNPSYYIGLLARSALLYPSLRDDCPKLAQVPPQIWDLPIIDIEGDHIIVAKDVDLTDPAVQDLLTDNGAATIVQLASSGVYSEALQGLLSLTDAEKMIHPELLPPPAPVMPPIAIVDLAGNAISPVLGGITGAGSALDLTNGLTGGAGGAAGGGAGGATGGVLSGITGHTP